ncbi:uncharacterized protein N7482_002750 [Penicillium canariense]|uniref:Zn(2)-C6 fungal-type domain-containing protein n=1 Tax=Penicillium canariense TaxID=189055 RepID=A0A9W9IFU5_9EURO|nr:uncharacterized protein N7482_002750 [Penicillium canariense]KAJ5176873.1 hypothetical protein N7482_002750 [Penicillium canariense]
MSGYYAGPFGRMFPVDGLSSVQPPEHPANQSESGENPYQLPPPRTPANLQFGSDPFLRRQRGENPESRSGQASAEPPIQRQGAEQLPSVRSLLTPVTGPSSPPSYHPQGYGTPTPIEHRELSYPFRHHEASLPPPVAGQDRHRSESRPQSQPASLPPLSHVGMPSPREVNRPHAATRSDPSTATLQHSPLPYHGASCHEPSLSGEVSSPEIPSRLNPPALLPHVVDERYIDGELCFVYADGSHQPKIVDGKPVNPNWGVTKAGKPRKRLAQACLTCREKKIKCQPNRPKCDQCQKSGRGCRFENALRGNRSRGSHSVGPSSTATSDVSSSIYNIARASDSGTSLPGTGGHSPVSEGSMLTHSGIESVHNPVADADRAHRQRTYQISHPFSDESPARPVEHDTANRLPRYSEILGELRDINPDDPLVGSWKIDPFDNDPEMTLHYVETYFSNVNDGIYHIFPRARFVLWLKSCETKSPEDKMLLYSMMALGSLFSDRPDRVTALRRYSRIARFAIQKSQHSLSLQLAQSHLIMSLLYYAAGSLVGSWDSIGAAGRAVSGLRFNIESGGVIVDQNQACDYGLHPQALIECRRRTFWVAFILDRVSFFFSATSTSISSESALIRLPCREEIYEAQQYATAPYFQTVLNQAPISAEDDRSALSPIAFLIQILSIWGDVSFQAFRLSHTPSDGWSPLAEGFHSTIIRRTDEWMNRLPEHLAFSVTNMERASQAKNVDALVSIHMFYHATLMKLYRHVRYHSLRSEALVQYIHRARYHAVEILRIALAVVQFSHQIQSTRFPADASAPNEPILSPFLGYVVLSAVDVLSAGGMVTELPDCIAFINGALGMIQLLGYHWDSSLSLANIIKRRLDSMVDCLNDRSRPQDKLGFAVDGPSLATKVPAGTPAQPPGALEEDLFYGSMQREILLRAMWADDTPFSDSNIAWLKDH